MGDYSRQKLSKTHDGTEHFSEVLNRPAPPTEADIQEAETDLDVNTDPPGKEEIIAVIKSSRTENPLDKTISLQKYLKQIHS